MLELLQRLQFVPLASWQCLLNRPRSKSVQVSRGREGTLELPLLLLGPRRGPQGADLLQM
jgi:hypothetical protein